MSVIAAVIARLFTPSWYPTETRHPHDGRSD